jgi:integrative and conjugative element protein (TIGR02256 family)
LFAFTRGDPLHQAEATSAWGASGGTVTFIGEWHTHPSGGVAPSAIDLRTWRRLTKANGRPMAFALVVPGSWGVFLAKPRLLRPVVTRSVPIERSELGVVLA